MDELPNLQEALEELEPLPEGDMSIQWNLDGDLIHPDEVFLLHSRPGAAIQST